MVRFADAETMVMGCKMQFPYGISDFQSIIEDDLFYVDRTHLIPAIERAGRQLIFLRPRRFGKSLCLSMLENYYDIAKKDRFDSLFGHLAIGKHPTPLHNRYVVMRWDFSLVSAEGNAADISRGLHQHINGRIEHLLQYYEHYIQHPVRITPENAIASFESLVNAINNAGLKLYLLIDEYDNFANELMMGSGDHHYTTLLHGEGAVRAIFKAVKGASAGMGLERVFITGVSPIAMSDITSAYNVASNIYLLPDFNTLCGFVEGEIVEILTCIAQEHALAEDQVTDALTMMRTFYNGYRFSRKANDHVYNPTMALYFLRHFYMYGEFPENILDENLAMDRNKIHYIARMGSGADVIGKALDDSQPFIIPQISERFGVRQMSKVKQDLTGLASLLYYLGALTQTTSKSIGKIGLRIPNLVMRKLYVEELQAALLPDRASDVCATATEAVYMDANIAPMCVLLEQSIFKTFSNRDYRWSDELTIKTAFLASLFNDVLFIMDSEPELNRGYADLSMIVRPDMRHYGIFDVLMEFKFIKITATGLTGKEVADASDDALHALPMVVQEFSAADEQLQYYIPALQKKYGKRMKLCSFAVVAVGFERLLWKRV